MLALFIYLHLCMAIAWANETPHQKRYSPDSYFLPVRLHIGDVPKMPTSVYREFTLDKLSPLATLDYGTHAAGLPSFDIASVSGPCQIEVKYSEQFSGLYESLSDGPSTFVSSLANFYPVETFNITRPGPIQSALIQGGQRWQTLHLITNGTVTIRTVAFKSTVVHQKVSSFPGTFKSSNPRYNEIWNLGARAWCTGSSSVPSYSAPAYNFTDYTLEFDAKITRGGVQWSMGYNFGIRSQGGIQLNLAGNYPAETTFANTNTTIFPPSTIVLGYGVAFVNQTTLSSHVFDAFSVPFEVQEGVCYRISSTIQSARFAVSINNYAVFNVSLDSYYTSTGRPISTQGSFGFGAWQDQSGVIRNVVAIGPKGNIIYQNALTDA